MVYRIELNGQVFDCQPGQTVLEAALGANILYPHNCRDGQCGRCKSRIISGDYYGDNLSPAITAEETRQGYLLACKVRPKSNLIIEIPLPGEAVF